MVVGQKLVPEQAPGRSSLRSSRRRSQMVDVEQLRHRWFSAGFHVAQSARALTWSQRSLLFLLLRVERFCLEGFPSDSCSFLPNDGFLRVKCRDSKLTMLLSESLGNINCQTIMIAHVSDSVANFMETLTTVQLASRIHGTRAKRSKVTRRNAPTLSGSSRSSKDTT